MLYNLIAVLFVVLGSLSVILAFLMRRQPKVMSLTKSVVIATGTERIYPFINDLRNFATWNTFIKADPKVQIQFPGNTEGVGAVLVWKGNAAVGEAGIGILETEALERVRMRLTFVKPFPSSNITEFTLGTTAPGQTTVRWQWEGNMTSLQRLMNIFVDLQTVTGQQMEQSLAALKLETESIF